MSITVEWIMTELVVHQDKVEKLKDEVKRVVGEKKVVEESDMARLPYLNAVVKEVLRFHPPGPFLVPRRAKSDQQVKGYLIPKGTQIFINVWGMGRDPSIWKNPDSFEPQRFIDKKADYKGHDFELIPFGSGRRMCPGMPLAERMVHMTIATLIHNFDWNLKQGAEPDQHRESVLLGGSLRRAAPLRIIPSKP